MIIKRAIFFEIIAMLLIIILTGCERSPNLPPADKITAKEAWGILAPAKETLGEDAIPAYILSVSMLPEYPVAEGKASSWEVGFYSESEKAVWVIGYNAEISGKAAPSPGEKRYSDVSLTVNDIAGWNIDSPEACGIAAQNGAGETDFMRLQAADLGIMEEAPIFKTPEFISGLTKLFWVIRDEKWDMYYIDANTGEYIGSCTLEYLRNIKD